LKIDVIVKLKYYIALTGQMTQPKEQSKTFPDDGYMMPSRTEVIKLYDENLVVDHSGYRVCRILFITLLDNFTRLGACISYKRLI